MKERWAGGRRKGLRVNIFIGSDQDGQDYKSAYQRYSSTGTIQLSPRGGSVLPGGSDTHKTKTIHFQNMLIFRNFRPKIKSVLQFFNK